MLKRYPKTFVGVCRVNPEDPAAPDHLSRPTERNGSTAFASVRLLVMMATGFADQLCLLSGADAPTLECRWRSFYRSAAFHDIEPLIEANPDLDVVIVMDHMADCHLDNPEPFAAV